MALGKGDKAPDFKLPDAHGNLVCLSELKGKKVVLYFYPKDDTSGCTVEAKDFSCLVDDFHKHGAVVLGMSPDRVWVEKSMYGRKYMGVERSTFLIGEDGTIREAWRNVKVPGHAEEVLKVLKG